MWSDKRLDDLARKVDAGFERVDTDIRELRTLMFQLWGVNMIADPRHPRHGDRDPLAPYSP